MCFDELDTVESMRGCTYVVFHVSNCYCCWFSMQLDNESTIRMSDSCVQVLLLVVAGRVSGVYY